MRKRQTAKRKLQLQDFTQYKKTKMKQSFGLNNVKDIPPILPELNDDIMYHIVTFLDPKDIPAFRLASQKTKIAADEMMFTLENVIRLLGKVPGRSGYLFLEKFKESENYKNIL